MKKGMSLLLVLISMFLVGVSASYAGNTELVSVDSSGNQGDSMSGFNFPSTSADGRYVAFQSSASNLVPGDTNFREDIFVRDRTMGTTERVSVDSNGNQGYAASSWPSISADGRYVAFESQSNNLVPGDTNNVPDIFVRDRATGETRRVNVDGNGGQANGWNGWPSISADGRYVAFYSQAANLVPGDTNGMADIFVHDRMTGVTERVSVDGNGRQANNGSSSPSISADGRYVAFYSLASNLVSGDTNNVPDIFVRDRSAGITERVSVDSVGDQANSYSASPSISADGRYVAFYSPATNLVPGDTNGTLDVFVRDRTTGVTERVSVDGAGGQVVGLSLYPSISADGRYVAFYSLATNLVPGDTNNVPDIFVRDRSAGVTERASVDGGGGEANNSSMYHTISADGRVVAFSSFADNLVPGDANGNWDIFVRVSESASSGSPSIEGIPDLIITLDVKNQGLRNSLLGKAEGAAKLAGQGNLKTAVNMLNALTNNVKAQKGKGIEPADADAIIDYINSVIAEMDSE